MQKSHTPATWSMGFLITKGISLMTALSMLLGPVYFYMDFFNRFGYFPG
mgnify:CR=1 FL=1|jgi:hypothetical protein